MKRRTANVNDMVKFVSIHPVLRVFGLTAACPVHSFPPCQKADLFPFPIFRVPGLLRRRAN
ncbi:hypothetical protein AA11825_2110 [Acetobacter pomorum DSM 11825]|nr:hypothetical protein AA11825_2110 [Acetobacter pomorum DSM 11825]